VQLWQCASGGKGTLNTVSPRKKERETADMLMAGGVEGCARGLPTRSPAVALRGGSWGREEGGGGQLCQECAIRRRGRSRGRSAGARGGEGCAGVTGKFAL